MRRGETISAGDKRSFLQILNGIGNTVGPRSGPNRRTQEQKELYCFRRYAATLVANGMWHFPCTVSMGESPDFMVEFDGGEARGLEVTEATTESYQRLLAKIDRDKFGICSLDDGWLGDTPERAWCDTVIEVIEKKLSLLGNYRAAGRHDILVYSNDSAFIVRGFERSQGYAMLKSRIREPAMKWATKQNIGVLSVLDEPSLLHDVAGYFNVWLVASP